MNNQQNANIVPDVTPTILAESYKEAWSTLLTDFRGCSVICPLAATGSELPDAPAVDQIPPSPEIAAELQQPDETNSTGCIPGNDGEAQTPLPVELEDPKPQPFVWRDITFDELVRKMRALQIPVDCTLLFKVCGGEVYIDMKTRTAWSEGVRPGITIILGTYGIGYGTMISGQSLSRSLHRTDRMKYLTWDEAKYRPAGQGSFLPLIENFYFHLGITYELDAKFSLYYSLKTFDPTVANEDLSGKPQDTQDTQDAKDNKDPQKVQDTQDTQEDPTVNVEKILADDGVKVEVDTVDVISTDDQTGAESPGSPTEGESLEGHNGHKGSRAYFRRTDPQSAVHRLCNMFVELVIRKETNVNFPTIEEMIEKDKSLSAPGVQHSMDPAEMASELERVLNETIETFLTHKEFFINPTTGYIPYGGVSFDFLIKYMMFGFGGQSAETSPVSFFLDRMPVTGSIRKAREQIREEGIEFFFTEFNKNLLRSEKLASLLSDSLWDNILLAVDGTSINVPHNPNDPDTLCKGARGSEYNQIHALCVYGILSGTYHGVIASGKKKSDEREALLSFIKKNEHLSCTVGKNKKYLIVADRGFESWEIFARLNMLGVRFVVRVKDSQTGGILSHYDLKKEHVGDEFEKYIRIRLHAKGCKDHVEGSRLAKFLDPDTGSYEMVLRVVQFRLDKGGNLEALITNVPTWELSALQLEYIYHKRWEVETSFRTLKYQFNLKYFHAKKPEFVRQEFWAKMVMFNFCSLLMTHTAVPEAKWSKGRKYKYAIKRSWGIALCMQFIKGTIDAETLGRKIVMNLQPIRPGRNYSRKVRPQSAAAFGYRAVG